MEETVKLLLNLVGGKDNITSLTHCVTRLRFVLKNEDLADVQAIEKLKDVKGVYHQNDQFQVVIGTNVQDYYQALMRLKEPDNQAEATNEKWTMKKLASLISEIFAPLIPFIILGGFCSGLENLFAVLPIHTEWLLWFKQLLHLVNTCTFAFVPAAILWSMAKRFGSSEILAIALGLMMILGAYIPELNQMAHYEGQVIPAVFGGILMIFLEKNLSKYVKPSLRMIVVPFGTLLTSLIAMQLVIGPIAADINHGLAVILSWCFTSEARFFIAPLVGYIFAAIVKSGLHHFTIPLDLIMISEFHFTYLWPLLALSNIAQGAACYFYGVLLEDSERQVKAKEASVSCMLGVTEPAMFGFNLPAKDPFRYAQFGSAAACLIAGCFQIRAYAIGIGGLPGIFSIVVGWDYLVYLLSILTAIAVPYYIMTNTDERKSLYTQIKDHYFIKFHNTPLNDEDECVDSETDDLPDESSVNTQMHMLMPCDGKIISLDDISDEVFSSRSMGDGIAIEMTDGHVISPVDGILTTCFPTGHAYGFKLSDETEVLLHIGMNTADAGADCFDVHVKQGDTIKNGQALADVNIEQLKEKQCSLVSPLVFIDQRNIVSLDIGKTLKAGDELTFEKNS